MRQLFGMILKMLQINEFLRNKFDFNYLEIDDAITGIPRVKYKEYKEYQYMIFHSIIDKDYSPSH